MSASSWPIFVLHSANLTVDYTSASGIHSWFVWLSGKCGAGLISTPLAKKTQAVDKLGLGSKSLAIPYFRMANCHTIIGANRFHFRVRDGIGWFTLAMVTKQTGGVDCLSTLCTQPFGRVPEICNPESISKLCGLFWLIPSLFAHFLFSFLGTFVFSYSD